MRGSCTRTAVWAATVAVGVMSCAVNAATAAAPTTIAPLQGETTIEAYGDVAAWSDYDAAARSWHMVVRRAGQISTPPLPTSKKAIQVDVGPGPTGAPMLAYAACASSCHVVVANVDGSHPQTVPGSRGASHPTIWGDRVAWVSGAARIMTSRPNGSKRSMLGGLPRRLCLGVSTPHSQAACQYPAYPSVEALQLQGRRLALIDSFGAHEGPTEVRIEAVTGGPARLVARMTVGQSARTWLGPSWLDGKLYFYMQSLGAGTAAWAFDPAHNTYMKAPALEWLSGFSMINSRQAIVATGPGAGAECGEAGADPCLVQLSRRFAFKPSKPLLATPD